VQTNKHNYKRHFSNCLQQVHPAIPEIFPIFKIMISNSFSLQEITPTQVSKLPVRQETLTKTPELDFVK
jgi:hypothetical protein